jgi:hypothetical protein
MAESEDLKLQRRTTPEGGRKQRPREPTIDARQGVEEGTVESRCGAVV